MSLTENRWKTICKDAIGRAAEGEVARLCRDVGQDWAMMKIRGLIASKKFDVRSETGNSMRAVKQADAMYLLSRWVRTDLLMEQRLAFEPKQSCHGRFRLSEKLN